MLEDVKPVSGQSLQRQKLKMRLIPLELLILAAGFIMNLASLESVWKMGLKIHDLNCSAACMASLHIMWKIIWFGLVSNLPSLVTNSFWPHLYEQYSTTVYKKNHFMSLSCWLIYSKFVYLLCNILQKIIFAFQKPEVVYCFKHCSDFSWLK